MVAVLVSQLIFSSLALARQADIDLVAYDAWDKAYVKDKSALAKFEKTVPTHNSVIIITCSIRAVGLLQYMTVPFLVIAPITRNSASCFPVMIVSLVPSNLP